MDLSAPLASGWVQDHLHGAGEGQPSVSPVQQRRGAHREKPESMRRQLPATRFVTFAEQQEDKAGTGVAYANPSSTTAMITFMAKDAAGQTLASIDRMMSPNGHGAENMKDLFGLSSFTGSLEITSTEPIVSLSLNFERRRYSPLCLPVNWMLPCRDRLPITSLILPWERVGKPPSPISITPRRK